MISDIDYVRQSLELHLFFARIMKEHSLFLELGFTPRDMNYTQQADYFRVQFDQLLADVISVSNGVVSPEVLQSGEVITPYTLNAERATAFYTGIAIPLQLTQMEANLSSMDEDMIDSNLEAKVFLVNQRAIKLIADIIQYKTTVLTNVLSCKMFTNNYPLLIDHVLREAKFYLTLVQRLQNKEVIDVEETMIEQEVFWNRIMAEHSKFIRGLLDPTEEDLMNAANNFGQEFDQLYEESKVAMDSSMPNDQLTAETLKATEELRDFKAQGTQGILQCKVRSIIIPLLGDHTLREANHYLRLLKIFEQQ
ncbi:MAG TPA: DUF2935 domain-containing protein [Lachnospiraceae bacterium]|nr:DUF2935 domain-containing protein [Lachnospiraceae bacterium]HEX3078100.1 DUF2935 domain-containing protein [Lachnospiraceae bacterium]